MAPADPDHTRAQLLDFVHQMQGEEPFVLGFPGNLAFDFSTPPFAALLSILANNVYDPFSADSSNVSAKRFEQAVIDFVADLCGGDRSGTYGYLTSGGSESNLWGLSAARHCLPNAPVYVSPAAHPSILKAAGLLRMQVVTVPTLPADDAMDPQALRRLTAGSRGGAIVVATVGTTMTGAADDVPALRAAAAAAGPVHVHVDAALHGLLAPFTDQPAGFRAGADTIAISAHKLLGLPVPCGIALGRQALVPQWETGQYTGASDHTLACSRSGLAAILVWTALRDLGREGLRRMAGDCLETAAYAHARLGRVVEARRHPQSIIVEFTFPGPIERYAGVCAAAHLAVENRHGTVISHVVTVPHVTPDAIDRLAGALAKAEGAPR